VVNTARGSLKFTLIAEPDDPSELTPERMALETSADLNHPPLARVRIPRDDRQQTACAKGDDVPSNSTKIVA
jgi:hypothetical protein